MRRVLLTSFIASLAGCADTVVVTSQMLGHGGVLQRTDADEPEVRHGGIPFMRTTIREVERLTCQQPWLLATLNEQIMVPADPNLRSVGGPTVTTVVRHPAQELPELLKLRGELLEHSRSGKDASDKVKEYRSRFSALKQDELEMQPAFTVARAREQQTVVDTKRVYFVNARMPWFGDAKLVPELSGGVLTKVEAAVTSNLKEGAESIIGLLSSTKSTKAAVDTDEPKSADVPNGAAVPAGGPPPPAPILTASLEIQEQAFVYTFEEVVAVPAPSVTNKSAGASGPALAGWTLHGTDCVDLGTLKSKFTFSRKLAGGTAPVPASAPAQENAITVRGTIELPDPPGK